MELGIGVQLHELSGIDLGFKRFKGLREAIDVLKRLCRLCQGALEGLYVLFIESKVFNAIELYWFIGYNGEEFPCGHLALPHEVFGGFPADFWIGKRLKKGYVYRAFCAFKPYYFKITVSGKGIEYVDDGVLCGE